MTDTLVIRLPEHDDAPASWVLVDTLGNRTGSVQSGPLSSATESGAGRRVIALVPGVDVLLAEPELPVRGGARLMQVVPFALEEQLADDVEAMHFAVGRRGERPGTPVAAVTRARMDAWLSALRAAQLEPSALYPETAALPANPSQIVLVFENDRLFVRHPDRPPFVVHADPLAEALDLAGLKPAPEAVETTHVIVYATPADWHTHQATFEVAREGLGSLKVQLLPEGALPLLAQQAVTQTPFNLLQGAYAPRSQHSGQWRRWRVAAILFAALIGLNLATKGVQLWQLKKTERNLDAAIEQTFHEAMPGEQNTIDARRRMETRLAAVRGGGTDGNSLLRMLGTVSSAFAQIPQTSIDALSFRSNVLDLKVAAKDVGSLDRLQTLVGQHGLSAQLQSSNTLASGVEGRVQITGQKGK